MSAPAPKVPPLLGPTLWLVVANVFRNVGLMAILIALTWLTGTGTVGRYALALAITTPAFAFAQLGLRGVYLTHVRSPAFRVYLLVQAGAALVALVASVTVAFVIEPSLAVTVLIVSVMKGADAFCEAAAGPLQRHGRSRLIFGGFFTLALVGTGVVVAALALSADLDLALAALTVVGIVVAAVFFVIPGTRLASADAAIPHGGIGIVLRAGLPTGLALCLLAFVPTIPQYFLAAHSGEVAVGYFAVLLYLFAAADLFCGTVSQAWVPRGRHFYGEMGRVRGPLVRLVARTVLRWTAIVVPLTVVGLLAAWVLYPSIFPGYALTWQVALPLGLAIGALPTLYFFTAGLAIRNLYRHNVTLGIVAASMSVIACALLVPTAGLVGAFWATAAAVVARAVAAVIVLARAGSETPAPVPGDGPA